MDTKLSPCLLTVPEVADRLNVNQNSVHTLRKAGLIPFLKLGAYKCRPEALDAFLQKYEGYDLSDPYHPVKTEGTSL